MRTACKNDFVQAFVKSTNTLVQQFGAYIRDGTDQIKIVCWNAAALWAMPAFKAVSDRAALWSALVDVGDPRALIFFLMAFQNYADVQNLAAQSAAVLPLAVRSAASALGDSTAQAARDLLTTQSARLQLLNAMTADTVPPVREATRRT